MATTIKNPSVEIQSLPAPLQGVLKGGETITLSLSTAQLLSACPSLGRAFVLSDLGSAYAGSTQDSTYGISGSASIPKVLAASTGNLTLSGEQTVDGVALVATNRVLAKNQGTASQNANITQAFRQFKTHLGSLQHLDVRQKNMSLRNHLRVLKVRHARHKCLLINLRLPDDCSLKYLYQ